MIDPKLLSFLKIVETGNYTKAAEKLSLSQPAVSQHMRLLEDELSVQLFDRVGGKLQLTREGRIVADHARRIVSVYGNLDRELKNAREQILCLPASNTQNLFRAALEIRHMRIDDFNVIMEIDNIATIKDLIRRNFEIRKSPKKAIDFLRMCDYDSKASRGRSSVGRALEWHSRGHGFDSHRLHESEDLQWSSLFMLYRGDPIRPLDCTQAHSFHESILLDIKYSMIMADIEQMFCLF